MRGLCVSSCRRPWLIVDVDEVVLVLTVEAVSSETSEAALEVTSDTVERPSTSGRRVGGRDCDLARA